MADKASPAEADRVKAEKESLEASDAARDQMLGEPVELEFLEKSVLPDGKIVEVGGVAELPKEQALVTVKHGKAKFKDGVAAKKAKKK